MSGSPIAAEPSLLPEPQQVRPASGVDPSSRTGRLLMVLRWLIGYGKELNHTLRQGASTARLAEVKLAFGTPDLALILALIGRALNLAAALEDRLIRRPLREAAPAATAGAATPRQPRVADPAARSAGAAARSAGSAGQPTDTAESLAAQLPTVRAIAEQLRHRPVGAVLAEICLDLGIQPSHPMWQELFWAMLDNGGNPAALFKAIRERRSFSPDDTFNTPPAWPKPYLPFVAPGSTGPP
jgi:hypothetical protein